MQKVGSYAKGWLALLSTGHMVNSMGAKEKVKLC